MRVSTSCRPSQRISEDMWYRGTADAVYQNMQEILAALQMADQGTIDAYFRT
jgi:ADP-glucose pyrophosphorylase